MGQQKLPADIVPEAAPHLATAPASGKVRPLTLADIDRRTRAYQAAERLLGELVADLGGDANVTAGERELAQRAAVLGAMIEDIEARWLRGEPVPLGDYLAAINCSRRLLCSIGLERRARQVGTVDPLAYAASKARAA